MTDMPADPVVAVSHRDPYPYYAALAADRPFHRDEKLNLWVAASAAAVRDVLQSTDCHVRPPAEPVPKHLGDGTAAKVFGKLVRMTEGAARDAVRQSLLRHLSALQPAQIAACADEIMASLGASGFDDVALDAMLFAYPVRCMAALLGLPPPAQAEAARCTGDYVRCVLPQASPEQIVRGDAAAEALHDLLRRHCTLLPINDDIMLSNAVGLLMQSHDATAGLLGNALVILGHRQELRVRLRADPTLLPGFIAEAMRFDPPVQNTRRFVAKDCEIQGCDLRAGDVILVLLAAAARDPALHDDPHLFRIERPPPSLIGFGHGRHACAGPEIAQVIAAAWIQYWVNHGLAIPQAIGYRPSANARIPYFAGQR